MRIDSEQLDKHLARAMGPLYTVLGEEPLLALEAGDRLRARAQELGCEERTLLISESGFDWTRLGEAAASWSLFSQRRLIICVGATLKRTRRLCGLCLPEIVKMKRDNWWS